MPSTTDTFVLNIIEEKSSKKLGQFGLGMVPEFLREGSINDAINPDRIVIGSETEKTKEILSKLFDAWESKKMLLILGLLR